MKKYYLGLMILGLITLGLTGYILTLGFSAKADAKTQQKAQEVADKLNSYIGSKQSIPDSLVAAGISDVPNSISYKKDSSTEYTFCVTYKSDNGYGTSDVTSLLTGAATAALLKSNGVVNYSGGSTDTPTSYKPSSLYLSDVHKKGQTCQTIKPYISSYNSSSSSSSTNQYCDPNSQYYQYYKAYCSSLQTTTN